MHHMLATVSSGLKESLKREWSSFIFQLMCDFQSSEGKACDEGKHENFKNLKLKT